ncbi:MAG: antitoxin VapB family protein [Nitrososphaerales archaeon]
MYVCPYMTMGSKNISITDEAYYALSRERRKGESFTEAIIRLARSSGKLSDCFGSWKMSAGEKEEIFGRELPKGWRKSTERLKAIEAEMP